MKRITLITIILFTGLLAKAPKGDMVQLTEWLYNDLQNVQTQVNKTNEQFINIQKSLDSKIKTIEDNNNKFIVNSKEEIKNISNAQETLSQSSKTSLLRLKQDVSYLNQEIGTLQSAVTALSKKLDLITHSISKKESMDKYVPSEDDAALLNYIGE